jgi:UDP-N-acetylglucosamine 3-dehydrogenase
MGRLNIAIIGCGWAGEKHLRALRELSDRAQVTAVVDNVKPFLREKAAEWGVREHFTDYRDVLSRIDVDAVSICLPHKLHAEIAVESARAGKHVLCEKPMAVSLEEADAMIRAAEESDVKLMIAESARFEAVNRRVKECIGSGCIGSPILLRQAFMPRLGSRTGYVYPGRRAWLSDREVAGGGQWLVNGIHHVSVARWLFGEVESIYAAEYRTPDFDLGIEANVCATLRFVSGALGELTCAPQTGHHGIFSKMMAHGDSGGLVVSRGDGAIHVYGEGVNTPDGRLFIEREGSEPDPFVLEMEHFLDYVQRGAPCICDGVSERESLAVVTGGYESMRTGKAVRCHGRT